MHTFLDRYKTLWVLWVLALIVLWGLLLRGYGLGVSSYWIDEGFTLAQAQAIAERGYPRLASGVVEWKDPLIPYLTAPLLWFTDTTATSAMRIWPMLFGLWSIAAAFLLGREIFTWRSGLIFAFFVSSGYWFIAWSQQVRGYSALIFFVILTFYLLMLAQNERDRPQVLYWAFVSCLLAVLANKLGVLLFVPYFATVVYLGRYRLLALLGICGIFGSVYLVGIAKTYVKLVENGYSAFYIDHLMSGGPYLLALMVIGFVVAYWKPQNRFFHLNILVWALLTLLALSYFVSTGEKRYILILFPIIFLYASYGLVALSEVLGRSRTLSLILLGFLFTGFVFFERRSLVAVPQSHYPLENYTPQPDFTGIYKAIRAAGFSQGDFIVSPFPWMDQAYLGRSGYSIPWSLTGKKDDLALIDGLGYYTGAPRIIKGDNIDHAIQRMDVLRSRGNVYVIIDSLSRRRMNQDFRHYIETHKTGKRIYTIIAGRDEIQAYVFDRM